MEFDTGASLRGLLQRGPHASHADRLRLVVGNAGDHKLVHALLRAANQAPSDEEFLTGLEEPTYEPSHRLLVKRGNQIVAHVRVLERTAWFGRVKLPIGGIEDLAVLPEYRDVGCESMLLSAAERAMRDNQAVLALTHTDRPDLLRQDGWSEVGSMRFTQANVNDVLGALAATQAAPLARRNRRLRIRRWRQVELDGLRAVYCHLAAATWGALERSEAYWRWLVNRRAHDELVVAIRGRDDWENLQAPSHIVGYAVVRGSQIVELATLPAYTRAASMLLARACQDAIERNHHTLALHIPPADPLHDLMISAGGRWIPNARAGGRSLLIKLLNPTPWIESLSDVLLERAKAAGISRPFSINFHAGRRRYRLELTRRSSHLLCEGAAIADVKCRLDTLGALFLGHLDIAAAQQSGQLEFRAVDTATSLAALFPSTAFWQSPFDSPRS